MQLSKTTIHVALDQYAFLEHELLDTTTEEALEVYHDAKKQFEGGDGASEKEFNAILDHYLTEHTMTSDEYESLNIEQQAIIQALKRSFKRINYKLAQE